MRGTRSAPATTTSCKRAARSSRSSCPRARSRATASSARTPTAPTCASSRSRSTRRRATCSSASRCTAARCSTPGSTATWALAGRVLLRGAAGRLETRLVRLDHPRLRVPQLAIHLDREVNDKGLVLNRQEHLAPVLGLQSDGEAEVRALVAAAVGAQAADVVHVGLDAPRHARPGARRSARRASVLGTPRQSGDVPRGDAGASRPRRPPTAGRSLVAGARALRPRGGGQPERHRRRVSFPAARSGAPLAPPRALVRRARARPVAARSACRPTWPTPSIPTTSRATSPATSRCSTAARCSRSTRSSATRPARARLRSVEELCRGLDIPLQQYVNRTDLPCGSTIGPITSTLLGMATADVGNPMLSMHSCREMAGTQDPARMERLMGAFFTFED